MEQPWRCELLNEQDQHTRKFMSRAVEAVRDQCMDGLINPKTGKPIRKRTVLQTNSQEFANAVELRCTHGLGEHDWLQGARLTSSSSFYPEPFCKAMAKGMLTKREDVKKHFEEIACKIARDHEEDDVSTDCSSDEEGSEDQDSDWEPDSVSRRTLRSPSHRRHAVYPALVDPATIGDNPEAEVMKKNYNHLVTIHRNLGHPSNRLMQKILREAKAPDIIIRQAGDLICDVCKAFGREKPTRPISLHAFARKLGECLVLDFSKIHRADGRRGRQTGAAPWLWKSSGLWTVRTARFVLKQIEVTWLRGCSCCC